MVTVLVRDKDRIHGVWHQAAGAVQALLEFFDTAKARIYQETLGALAPEFDQGGIARAAAA